MPVDASGSPPPDTSGAKVRIAAAGDVHCNETTRERTERAFAEIDGTVDLILLAGDLTTYGEPEQGAVLADACRDLTTPVVAVLGNHDWHDPQKMYEHGEKVVSDDDLKQSFIVSSDPDVHAERIREVEEMGASTVVVMNNSGADPHGAIRVYGEHVLPALKGARVS